MHKAFLVGALAASSSANLVVLGPEEIVKKIDTDKHMIPANYANFGHIPYGQSIVSFSTYLTAFSDRPSLY